MKKKIFWSDEAHIHFHKNKGKVVGAHYCKDIFGNWYWGYEEQLNYDLGH